MAKHIVNIPLTEGSVDFLTDLNPDLRFESILDVDVEEIVALGVNRLLIDFDQTLVAPGEDGIDPVIESKVEQLVTDERIKSVDIATANLSMHVSDTMEMFTDWMLTPEGGKIMRVFNPENVVRGLTQYKTEQRFWKNLLFHLDADGNVFDDPSSVMMIGDSHVQDIAVPSSVGLRTCLVNRRVVLNDYSEMSNPSFREFMLRRQAAQFGIDQSLFPVFDN